MASKRTKKASAEKPQSPPAEDCVSVPAEHHPETHSFACAAVPEVDARPDGADPLGMKDVRLFTSFFVGPLLGLLTGFSAGSIAFLALNFGEPLRWHQRAFAIAAIPLMAHRMVLAHRLRRMGSVPSSALPTNTRVDPALARGRFTRITAKVVDTEIR